VVVSEETGYISIVDAGVITENISPHTLRQFLIKQKT